MDPLLRAMRGLRAGLLVTTSLMLLGALFGPSTRASAAPPAALPYEVQVWPEGAPGYVVLIVSVQLSETVSLPATVRMALPPDSEITWTGEILGTTTESDIRRDYTLVPGSAEGTSVEFVLERSRVAQYEAVQSEVTYEGRRVNATALWTQTESASSLRVTVRVPSGVSNVTMDPPATSRPATNDEGERLYRLADLSPLPGESKMIRVSYERSGAGVSTDERRTRLGGTTTVLSAVIVVLFVAVALLAFAVRRDRSRHT